MSAARQSPGPSPAEARVLDACDVFYALLGSDRQVAVQMSYDVAEVADRYRRSSTKEGSVMSQGLQAALEKIFSLRKAYLDKPHALALFDGILGLLGVDVSKLTKGLGLAKAAKAVEMGRLIPTLQALRDQREVAGDLEGAELYSQAIRILLEAAGPVMPAPPTQTKMIGKQAPSALIKEQIENVHRLANTATTATERKHYQQQYDALRKDYGL